MATSGTAIIACDLKGQLVGRRSVSMRSVPVVGRSTVVPFALPSEFSPDPLTAVIRAGAKELLRTAVQAEVSTFIAEHVSVPGEYSP